MDVISVLPAAPSAPADNRVTHNKNPPDFLVGFLFGITVLIDHIYVDQLATVWTL